MEISRRIRNRTRTTYYDSLIYAQNITNYVIATTDQIIMMYSWNWHFPEQLHNIYKNFTKVLNGVNSKGREGRRKEERGRIGSLEKELQLVDLVAFVTVTCRHREHLSALFLLFVAFPIGSQYLYKSMQVQVYPACLCPIQQQDHKPGTASSKTDSRWPLDASIDFHIGPGLINCCTIAWNQCSDTWDWFMHTNLTMD